MASTQSPLVALVALGAALVLTPPGALTAQDMVFGLADAEVQTSPATAAATPPSKLLARGLREYGKRHYAQAAVHLQRVTQGDTREAPGNVQRARHHLAKALVHLGYDQSALAIFDEISLAGPQHPYFAVSLPWLARIAERTPDPGALAAMIGRYRPGDIEGLDAGVRNRLLLLMGRAAYDQRELARAIELLSRVPQDSPRYLDARMLLGITHVRARHARPSIAAFREVIRAVEDGDADDAANAKDLEALAWLSLGRIYYTAAQGRAGGPERAQRGKLLGSAVEAWSNVSSRSEHWLDALFESSWALFVSDEHARALGNVHALLSPFFRGAFYPEAHVIKAVALYHSCQMDNASKVVRDFHRRYAPLREELSTLLARRSDGYKLFTDVRDGSLGASRSLTELLSRAFRARDVRRATAQLASIRRQHRALARSPLGLRGASVGERILQDLHVADAFARERLGALALTRAERQLGELQEIANQMDTVEIEIINWQRKRLTHPPQAPRGGGGQVHVDSEHVLWPFDGEYWRDELGYYRQQVSDRCPAR